MIFDDSVNENKWLLKKNVDIWGETKNEIKAINGGKENDYGKDYMKIKFTSVAIIIRSIFEGGKLYPQVFFRWCFEWIIRMLQYEKISISEGIDTNKTSASKECELCHYWYFKDVGFRFETHVCNKCHNVLVTAYELKNVAILNVKGVDFRCILRGVSRNEAVNRLNDPDKSVL